MPHQPRCHSKSLNVGESVLQHVRAAHEDLRAVITALLQAYPQHLKEDWFTLDAFLWVSCCTTPVPPVVLSLNGCLVPPSHSDTLAPPQAVQMWTAYSMQVGNRMCGRQHAVMHVCWQSACVTLMHCSLPLHKTDSECRFDIRLMGAPQNVRPWCPSPA